MCPRSASLPELPLLRLRPVQLHDWPTIHEWAGRADVTQYQAWGPNRAVETRPANSARCPDRPLRSGSGAHARDRSRRTAHGQHTASGPTHRGTRGHSGQTHQGGAR